MLKNYFLIAIRHFWRHKTFSLINILGLAIGISASLVIFLIVSYDFSFDKFEPQKDRVYRVVSSFISNGEPSPWPGVTYALPQALSEQATGIEVLAPFVSADAIDKVTVPNSTTPAVFKNQDDIAYADSAYCSLLGYTWLVGSPNTALSQPYQVVLTETSAKKYFPHLNYDQLIGRNLVFADSITTTVSGIIKDLPGHTDFDFKTLLSYSTLHTKRLQPNGGFDNWGGASSASQLFIRLTPGATPENMNAQLKKIFLDHNPPPPGSHNTGTFLLEPLSDLHFDATYIGIFDNTQRMGNKAALYSLMAVALFLLLLACINFINLTTAQAANRAKEIGIRKTMGSGRWQLGFQFLNETFLLTLIATGLSVALTPMLLKAFSDFIPQEVHFSIREKPGILVFLLLLAIVVSLLSGAYPSLVLSSFKPISVLKDQRNGNAGTRGVWLRKSLTVTQFVIAQVFIIGTILVARQTNYILNKDLGFKKDAIVNIFTPFNRPASQRKVLLQKLKTIPGIVLISNASAPPSSGMTSTTTTRYDDGHGVIKTPLQCLYADTNYIRLFHVNLLAGNNITQCDTTNQLVVNETYARILGFSDPRKALGARLNFNDQMLPIVGVVADFHHESLHKPIKPMAIINGTDNATMFEIALPKQSPEGTAWKRILSSVQDYLKAVYPEDDLNYEFFDESIANFYQQEQNISKLLRWATGLAIFISCLGLLGLVIYITNQRTKEIGVRKVIGATVTQIVFLLSKDFMKLIGVAVVIAMPIAWWGSHQWLDNFAYKADLSWWIFASGAAVLVLIALAVLCIRAYKAASANPVKSLRSE
jgi:putative ABC transport system permease protein